MPSRRSIVRQPRMQRRRARPADTAVIARRRALRRRAPRSVRRAPRRPIRNARREELCTVDRIERVAAATELAAHLHGYALGEHRIDLRATEADQHLRDSLARAAATEIDRRRLEHAHVVL